MSGTSRDTPGPQDTRRSPNRVTALQALPLAANVCSWEIAWGPELLCSCPCPLGSALDVSWPWLAGYRRTVREGPVCCGETGEPILL